MMGAKVAGIDGKDHDVFMGSYGIGPSRVVAALIEASHDDSGIIWPSSIAPFDVGIINLRVGSATDKVCQEFYDKLVSQGHEPLYDDTDSRAGEKFTLADLIGIPYQLIVGPKGLESGEVEIKERKTGTRHSLSLESAMSHLSSRLTPDGD